MLEHSEWLVSPWQRIPDEDPKVGWMRSFRDGTTQTPLGCVRQIAMPTGAWPWRRALRFEASELPDESHVFTLVRSWWSRTHWKVLDADEMLVGKIVGAHLLDPWGRSHGRLGDDGALRGADGHVLARIVPHPSVPRPGTLRVTVEEPSSPFWKMLLLGQAILGDMPV